jgi:hypothetical protein
MAGTFWTDEVQNKATSDGIYYQFSVSVDLQIDDKSKTLDAGEGSFGPWATRSAGKMSPKRVRKPLPSAISSGGQRVCVRFDVQP